MENFSDFSVWGTYVLLATLFVSLLVANTLKRKIPFLKNSLIPTSVLGGLVLLLISAVYNAITDEVFFNTAIFAGKGTNTLEIITYHTLALGFIASTLKTSNAKFTKKRAVEIFDSGVTTVATYLLQGIAGLAITAFIALFIIKEFYPAAGVLLPFSYGQGTGQALNYGNIYEQDGFVGGRSFGLTIAALGFLSAALGGVFHLNIRRKRGKLNPANKVERYESDDIQKDNEIPMQESIDKFTIQIAFIALVYFITYALMYAITSIFKSEQISSIVYGFNFIIGVLTATLVKQVIKLLHKTKLMKREYTNNFLLTRASNFFFDIMVVAGIAAIRLDILEQYLGIMLILGFVGAIITYIYTRLIAKVLFPDYHEEQFLATYGMLTGTASTGIILLREIDGDFKTPAADNMVYQTFPAIVLGFPMMFLAIFAQNHPWACLAIFVIFFVILNLLLFRSKIFRRKNKKNESE